MTSPTLAERAVNRIVAPMRRRPVSRRGFLATAAVTGAALAVEPWGYLTKPVDAYATVCGGTDNSCAAGYTVFCCTVNGGKNSCPPGTFAGGWWKADRSSFCGGAARYYIDCNAAPGTHWTCKCNNAGCDHRRYACNIFRYGQCNTQINGISAVVCRQVSCTPPWQIYPGVCSTSSATDNNTAGHDAPCLHTINWNSGPLMPIGHSLLHAGSILASGQHLTAPNRRTMLAMQTDGNLVIYYSGGPRWSSRTNGKAPGGRLAMQRDGNLVIYTKVGKPVWQTQTAGRGAGGYLAMQSDGNLVLYNAGHARWQSKTGYPNYP